MKSVFDRITAKEGDITEERAAAIVNAANRSLLGGGGVDGAIHRAAGPELARFCAGLGGCETGEAKITPGFRLAAQHVIHAVGPVYRGGSSGEAEKLASCYRRSLELAAENGSASVAFPAISTGAYGYPFEEASRIAVRTVMVWLEDHPLPGEVRFVLYGPADFEAFRRVLEELRAEAGTPE